MYSSALGLPGSAPAPVPAAPSLAQQERQQMGVLALSVVGGLFVGSWAIGHFREGLEDEERKKLIRYVAGAAVVGAAVWIFDLDKRFWDIDAATKWADEEASKAWAAHQAGSP